MAGIGKYEGVGNFKRNTPIQYAPFKMKAADQNNSPIEKNYGSPAHRGFGTGNLVGGVQGKSIENQDEGPGSLLNSGSPAKKWWKKAARIEDGVATGGLSEVAIAGKKALDKRKAAKEAEAAAQAETGGIAQGVEGGGVPPHGDEAHTDVGGAGDGMAGDAVAEQSIMAKASKKANWGGNVAEGQGPSPEQLEALRNHPKFAGRGIGGTGA